MVPGSKHHWRHNAWRYGFIGLQVFAVTFVSLCVLGFLAVLIGGYLIAVLIGGYLILRSL